MENNRGTEDVGKKKKSRKYLLSLAIVLVLVASVGGVYAYMRQNQNSESEFEKQVNAITEIDYSKQQEELDKIVEEGMINIQYSLSATFNGKVSESFNVKNIKNNHYPIVFALYDEDGNVIYQSKKIELGYEINSIELDKELSKGTHECKIQIGYAEDGNVSAMFPITIVVK